MSRASKRIPTGAERHTIFLDSNILLQYLKGKLDWLFSPAALEKFSYAINPIVLQELVLQGNSAEFTDRLESVRKRTELRQIEPEQAKALLRRARELRNRAVHSNDLLILSSAADCDYFATDDQALQAISHGVRPVFLSSAELRQLVEAKA